MSGASPSFDELKIRSFEHWNLFLHGDQSYLGRTVLSLGRSEDLHRGVDVDPFLDTTPDEMIELQVVLGGLSVALDELYQPTRLNYANLRNTWPACHWHIVPRYEGEDYGLRLAHGYEFRDLNPGQHYKPSPEFDIPIDVVLAIRQDIADGVRATI